MDLSSTFLNSLLEEDCIFIGIKNNRMEEKEELSKLKLEQANRKFPTTKPKENIIPLSCPSCNTPPEMEHINIHDKIAKCGSCATVFSFEQEVKQVAQLIEKIEPEEIARPAGVEKSYFHDELELSMKQPTGGLWIVFTVFFAFFAGLFYLVHLKKGIPIYVPGGFIGLALLSFYKYWVSPNEKIYTVIDDEYLSIQYRPKNFVKDKLVRNNEIEQIYVKSIASNYYSLYAVLNTREGQKHERLIQYIDTRNKARYIELELEKHLGIEDKRLPEESTHPTPSM